MAATKSKSKSKINQDALFTVLHDRLSKKAREIQEKHAQDHARNKNVLIGLIADLRKKALDENLLVAEAGALVATLQATLQTKGDTERNKTSVEYRVDTLDLLANPCMEMELGDLKSFQISASINVTGKRGHMMGNVYRDVPMPKEFIDKMKSLQLKKVPQARNLDSVVELLVAEAVLEAEDGSDALRLVDKLVEKAIKELFK